MVLDAVDDSLGKPITFLKDAYQNVNYYLDSIRTQKDTAKNKFRSIVAIVKDTYVSMKYSKDQSIQLFKEKKDNLSTSIFSLIFFICRGLSREGSLCVVQAEERSSSLCDHSIDFFFLPEVFDLSWKQWF